MTGADKAAWSNSCLGFCPMSETEVNQVYCVLKRLLLHLLYKVVENFCCHYYFIGSISDFTNYKKIKNDVIVSPKTLLHIVWLE